ncbi:NADH-quinone oxidoreductase subunit D-related protein [Streptomyces sp. NPDC001393]
MRIDQISLSELPGRARELLIGGHRLALVAAHHDEHGIRVVHLFAAGPPDTRTELHVHLDRERPELPTLAHLSFPAGRFEREMRDLFGIVPCDHPLPRRLVRHFHWPRGWYPMRPAAAPPPLFGEQEGRYPFLEVEGDGVYEIPAGPVHAGLIEPGHFRFSIVGETILRLKARLWFVHKGVEITDLALGHSTVRDRFTGTAVLKTDAAREIGCLGYVARASGLAYDARVAHPFTDYGPRLRIPVHTGGDVLARFLVRAEEIDTSLALLEQLAGELSAPRAVLAPPPLPGTGPRTGVGLVEGWRGTITTRVELAPDGTLTRVKPVDPSFFNWPALPVALADTMVPDFPPDQQELQPLLRGQRPLIRRAGRPRGAYGR